MMKLFTIVNVKLKILLKYSYLRSFKFMIYGKFINIYKKKRHRSNFSFYDVGTLGSISHYDCIHS